MASLPALPARVVLVVFRGVPLNLAATPRVDRVLCQLGLRNLRLVEVVEESASRLGKCRIALFRRVSSMKMCKRSPQFRLSLPSPAGVAPADGL